MQCCATISVVNLLPCRKQKSLRHPKHFAGKNPGAAIECECWGACRQHRMARWDLLDQAGLVGMNSSWLRTMDANSSPSRTPCSLQLRFGDPGCATTVSRPCPSQETDNIAWNTGGSEPNSPSFPAWVPALVANVIGSMLAFRHRPRDVVAKPSADQDSVSRCVFGPGYTFAWPDQSEPAVGVDLDGQWKPPPGNNAFEEGRTPLRCPTTSPDASTPTKRCSTCCPTWPWTLTWTTL